MFIKPTAKYNNTNGCYAKTQDVLFGGLGFAKSLNQMLKKL